MFYMFYYSKHRKMEILHRRALNVFKWGSVGTRPTTAHQNERDSIVDSIAHS